MTILFFTHFFYPHIGGVEKHVFEISKRLVKKGHTVFVITENHGWEPTDIKDNIHIHRIPVGKEDWFKKFRIWIWLWKYRKYMKEADVIHCHDVFFWYLPFRFLYPSKKVYTTFHGYETYPISKKAIFIRKLSEKLSRGNICIGDFIKKWYGTHPSFVLYGAAENPISEYPIQKKHSAVFIGRLDDQTGIMTYVEAIKIIRKKFPNFQLQIIGDGYLSKRVQKSFPVNGFKENPLPYLQKSRFAFVSRYLGILEAMAQKRLVFAVYDNPVKEDYLKTSPMSNYINIDNNPVTLAEKMNFYLSHPEEEKKRIAKAYAFASKQTWEKIVGIYEDLWKI